MSKGQSSSNYTTKSMHCNCNWLVKTFQGVMLHYDGQCKIHQLISDEHGAYHAYWPAPDVTLAMYLEEFMALVDTIEHYGHCIGHDTTLLDHETSDDL